MTAVHSASPQQSALGIQAAPQLFFPAGQPHVDDWQVPPPAQPFASQAGSAQSMAPLQSLSRPSSQRSADAVQPSANVTGVTLPTTNETAFTGAAATNVSGAVQPLAPFIARGASFTFVGHMPWVIPTR